MNKNKPESSKSSQTDPLDLGDYTLKKTLMELLAEDPQKWDGIKPLALLEAENQLESLENQDQLARFPVEKLSTMWNCSRTVSRAYS